MLTRVANRECGYEESHEELCKVRYVGCPHRVINYTDMIKSLTEVVEEEQFFTKSLSTNVKLACSTPDTYRAIIKHCKEQNIYYHTYQLKDRAFRVVIKHLHHTTDLDDIKHALRILDHEVRNIINVTHRQTKEPLNIFFVDLEPVANNNNIYDIKAIQNKIVHIEPHPLHQAAHTAMHTVSTVRPHA